MLLQDWGFVQGPQLMHSATAAKPRHATLIDEKFRKRNDFSVLWDYSMLGYFIFPPEQLENVHTKFLLRSLCTTGCFYCPTFL